jgi:hypothetical protein
MNVQHVVVVPSAPALLPSYSGLEDPLPDVREAARSAVAWLVARSPERITVLVAPAREDNVARGVPQPAGVRIAAHLLADCGFSGEIVEDATALLVVANGSAKRSEKAPGHLDDRAAELDAVIDRALRDGDPGPLAALDLELGAELWGFDVPAFAALGSLGGRFASEVDHAGDPFGVQYWVVRWTCVS